MLKDTIGSSGEKIVVFYTYKDSREFDKFERATETLINPSVLQTTLFIVFTDDVTNPTVPENSRFIMLSRTDFGRFGKLKNKEVSELLRQKFDVLLVFDEVSPKMVKLINKVSARQRIVDSRTPEILFDIRLNSNSVKIEQIINFAKETLEKISIAYNFNIS